jgi:hypothetical protein
MKMAIDVKRRKFVEAESGLRGEFICPDCGSWIYLKHGAGKRGAYFTHARSATWSCFHADKDSYALLMEGNDPSIVEKTNGFKRYVSRMKKKAERMMIRARQYQVDSTVSP